MFVINEFNESEKPNLTRHQVPKSWSSFHEGKINKRPSTNGWYMKQAPFIRSQRVIITVFVSKHVTYTREAKPCTAL